MMKRFFGIFICLFAVLLMSHNVFAADVDFNGEPVVHQITITDFYSRWNSTTSYTLGRVHTGGFNEFTRVEFYPQICYQLPVGAYYMEINYNLGASNAVSNNPLWFGGPTYAVYNASSSIMPFLSSNEMSSTTSGLTYRTYRSIFKYSGGTLLCNNATITMASSGGMFASESYRINSVVFWKVNNSGASNQDIINSINNQSQSLDDINNGIQDTNDKLDDLKDSIDNQNSQEEDAVQDSSDQAQQDADQAQQDANQATSSLLGVGSSIVSTIVNQPATNCLIDMTFAHYTVGNVNLCDKVPSSILSLIQGLASLVIVPIIAMYALYLLNKLIGLLRGFTG